MYVITKFIVDDPIDFTINHYNFRASDQPIGWIVDALGVPGGFLTIIAVVTPYYSNNYYISCDKFDSH